MSKRYWVVIVRNGNANEEVYRSTIKRQAQSMLRKVRSSTSREAWIVPEWFGELNPRSYARAAEKNP